MPKLAADCQDPETFLSWYLDYRGWTAIHGVTMYIIGPLPPRPGIDPANPDLRTSWDAKVAEGLRYLCAALADDEATHLAELPELASTGLGACGRVLGVEPPGMPAILPARSPAVHVVGTGGNGSGLAHWVFSP